LPTNIGRLDRTCATGAAVQNIRDKLVANTTGELVCGIGRIEDLREVATALRRGGNIQKFPGLPLPYAPSFVRRKEKCAIFNYCAAQRSPNWF